MKKHLNFSQRLLVAGTLFGMFFGAGNLIFPVHLGQLAGSNMLQAMAGFVITAVGIPILGVAAIGNTHSDGLQSLASKVGKGYGYVFTCLLYLTIGLSLPYPDVQQPHLQQELYHCWETILQKQQPCSCFL